MDIWVMDADGSNQTRLTVNEMPDYQPVWSPDGTKIVFTQLNGCIVIPNGEIICFVTNIMTMNANGSNPTFVVGGSAFDDDSVYKPDWSPDGTKIVFEGYVLNGEQSYTDIFVINTNGNNRINLTNNANQE